MYNECECARVWAWAHVGGEAGRGHRSQAGPKLAQGSCSCSCSNLKWRLARQAGRWQGSIPKQHSRGELWPMTRRVQAADSSKINKWSPGGPCSSLQ